jgi:hypothetical protein
MKILVSISLMVLLSLVARGQNETTDQQVPKSACGVAGHDHADGEGHSALDEAVIEEMRQKALAEMERYYRENKDLNGFDEEAYQQRLQAILNPPSKYPQVEE